MKKLSSRSTFFYKRIFPVLWFGFIGVFFLVSISAQSKQNEFDIMFIVAPILMAVVGYFIMKKFVFDLIDEVYDEGSSLLFKNSGIVVRVSLRDIMNVSYSLTVNPQRVTLSLRYQTELGDKLSFTPPISLIPFKKNRDIEELIDRIDKARGAMDTSIRNW